MTQPGQRLAALDAFRGITIVGMILVNNPGSWGAIYAPLRHAEWHGWTPTDLIFPFFLWIVGVAIAFAIGRRVQGDVDTGRIVRRIVRRALVLIGLGLFLAAYPKVFYDPAGMLATWRFPGVLQRIGVCYAVVSLLYLWCSPRTLRFVCWSLLLGYWALMTLVPVPGQGAPDLDGKGTHLAAWVDRAVFGEAHLWTSAKVYDPEGLLSTLPAIATTLFGLFVGLVVRDREVPLPRRVLEVFRIGAVLTIVGWAWGEVFPINKPIWTSSYAVFTAGLAATGLGLCLWAADLRGYVRWTVPFRIYGVNAITVFVGSALLAKTLGWIQVGGGRSLRSWIYSTCFDSWLDGELASLAYAVTWIVGWYVVLRAMDARGIRLKV